ncbi:very short patch repair endonuclease [Desulfovibrio sp. OttesenSCG-928-I05]|nr:very short patch repair endonuclease [Desulfovibrio sp. OttesenSCG-928-I05]
MGDRLTQEQRRRCMSSIKNKDSTPEMVVRKGLHKLGLRYRLHAKNLPGTPDLVFTKYRTVLFVHGCFWHKHDCYKFSMPATRTDFWQNKLKHNKLRDERNIAILREIGWRVIIIWECAISGKKRQKQELLLNKIFNAIKHNSQVIYELRGE